MYACKHLYAKINEANDKFIVTEYFCNPVDEQLLKLATITYNNKVVINIVGYNSYQPNLDRISLFYCNL